MFHNEFSNRAGQTDEFLTRTLLGSVAMLLVVCLVSWTTEPGSPDAQQLAQTPNYAPPQVVSQLEPVLP
ncbi:hypothetical protein [Rivibacter subsaxonicus]|uniref:Uncharacterized protein n=1 Tax=Rivibacter subsaxonicus TaxID=457575 RepID=A0A4Q7VPF1_9BURK|nr:hypothetical protein [Rivibacter subsaxonicus]RZT98008.1 hypothetical protein EV670_2410 [Rivibacter subsaxonicus]